LLPQYADYFQQFFVKETTELPALSYKLFRWIFSKENRRETLKMLLVHFGQSIKKGIILKEERKKIKCRDVCIA
jgi:hypothetical protein